MSEQQTPCALSRKSSEGKGGIKSCTFSNKQTYALGVNVKSVIDFCSALSVC